MILVLLIKKTRLCLCRGFFVLFFLLFPLLLFSCASNNAPVQEYAEYLPSESHILWQKVDGAEFASYFFYENTQYPVRYHCVKIDLSKKITILTFPNSENDFSYKNGSKTDFFTGMTAKQFSARFAPVVAVNSAPFKGKWERIDHIFFAGAVELCAFKVFDEPPFIDQNGFPARFSLFSNSGLSDHLPLCAALDFL